MEKARKSASMRASAPMGSVMIGEVWPKGKSVNTGKRPRPSSSQISFLNMALYSSLYMFPYGLAKTRPAASCRTPFRSIIIIWASKSSGAGVVSAFPGKQSPLSNARGRGRQNIGYPVKHRKAAAKKLSLTTPSPHRCPKPPERIVRRGDLFSCLSFQSRNSLVQ